MMMNKLLEEIKKDEELNKLISTLTDEEIEENLLILYKQKQDNDYIKKNKGLKLDNDETFMESYLEKRGSELVQVYRPAKYQEVKLAGLYMPSLEEGGKLYKDDSARINVFNALKKAKTSEKGVYLYGSYGSGKTYIMLKYMKELAKDKRCMCVYYPEFINSIKARIARGESIDDTIDELKEVDILFIDDIGREQNTIFNRDQVLSVIVNYRYQYKLKTFMTSNRSIDELDSHLAETNDKIDHVASGAITDRIRNMMEEVELSGKDYKKIAFFFYSFS